MTWPSLIVTVAEGKVSVPDELEGIRLVLRSLTETLQQAVGVLLEMVRSDIWRDRSSALLILSSVISQLLFLILIALYLFVAAITRQEIDLFSVLLAFLVLSLFPLLGFLLGLGPLSDKANRQSLEDQFDMQRRNLSESEKIS